MLTLRSAPSTEFGGGSCRDSRIGWRPHICQVLPGCMISHSKTLVNLHTTGLPGDWCGCAGVGMEVGSAWDVVGMGGGHGWWGGDGWWRCVGVECRFCV